ncbi:A24 family peptidase [Marinomonas transparens]|uniref:Prepilin peptidase n=1 Tax=Marinomonas transparens TaxID=2795388 RepID=A0A934JPP5_9GAMM|nr:prepilin peptidase [Marinomonas transparens]MBJ7536147.1 prepilin peptidase [Marinomonas transparens]
MASAVVCFMAIWVIFTDLFYRRIHNLLIIGLIVGWCVSLLVSAWSMGSYDSVIQSALLRDAGFSLLGAVCVLVVGFGLFLVGQMGAGDVKLMSVLCLWVGYDDQLIFLIVTALVGGMLALFMPFVTLLEFGGAKLIMQMTKKFPRFNIPPPIVFSHENVKGLPYGLAISAGAIYTLISPFSY